MISGKKYRFPKYRHLIFAFVFFFVLFLWKKYKWKTDNNLEEDPSWIEVPNFKIDGRPEGYGELYIFSAYFDTDDENIPIVRIIATAPNAHDTNVTCHFYGESGNLLLFGNGIVQRLHNIMKHPYRGGFVLCPLTFLEESEVYYISVSNGTDEDGYLPSTPLKISRIPKDSKPKHEFAICVQPVFNYDSVFDFIQWVEFHKMMGVTHFTFYNITMGPKVSCALHALLDSTNSLTLFNGWGSAPMINNATLIFNHAQHPQIVECNLRYRGRAKYYLNVDLDEYIVPNFTLAKNYSELMSIIGENETLPISQYIFRNAFFFPKEINSNSSSTFPSLEDLILHSRITRKKYMEPHKVRSKYMAHPLGVLEPGVHRSHKLVPPFTYSNVSADIAYLHHYRKTLKNKRHMRPQEDAGARSITDELLVRVTKSTAEVEKTCNIKIDDGIN